MVAFTKENLGMPPMTYHIMGNEYKALEIEQKVEFDF
jgi:hypothetical protein